ncbi:hypothetical protein U2181_15400, partial [Listeria monocytogenes]|uniref:hypothetical protein n=1 Tax=Listeria monocytogenes TaxID=1639 RepID=UPI002FDBCB8A
FSARHLQARLIRRIDGIRALHLSYAFPSPIEAFQNVSRSHIVTANRNRDTPKPIPNSSFR